VNGPFVRLTIGLGREGHEQYAVNVPLREDMLHEMSEPMEESDSPMSHLLRGWRPGTNAFEAISESVTLRKRVFEMREEHAAHIAKEVTRLIKEHLSRRDVRDGYTKEQQAKWKR